MKYIERLKELSAIIEDPKYDPWEAGISYEVCMALPKLLAVVDAAENLTWHYLAGIREGIGEKIVVLAGKVEDLK
jgi:hypothetical protein